MSRSVFAAGLALLVGTGLAQVDTTWVRHFQYSPSYPTQNVSVSRTMARDADGNVSVTAWGQYDQSGLDYIVMKYDSLGKLLWSAKFDGGANDISYALAVDATGAVYVTGQSTVADNDNIMLTVKWDAAGNLAWATKVRGDITSRDNVGRALVVTPNAVYVAGQVTNAMSGQDFALARLNPATGAIDWVRAYSRCGSAGYSEQAGDLLVDGTGAIYVAGVTHGGANGYDATLCRYDALGNQIWARSYDGGAGMNITEAFTRVADGGGIIACAGYAGTGGYDLLTAAYAGDGTQLWSRTYGGPGGSTDMPYDIEVDASGNVYVCGMGSGAASSDMVTVKYSPAGSQLWVRLYDVGLTYDGAMSIDLDPSGSVLVAGGTISSGIGSVPMLVAIKYGADGSIGWTYLFRPPGSTGANYGANVISAGSSVYVSGPAYWSFPNYSDPTLLRLKEIPDVGAYSVLAPTGAVAKGVPVAPRAEIRNFSLQPATFPARFQINDGYQADTTLTLGPYGTITVAFPSWTPTLSGAWIAKCSTRAVFDYNHLNDSAYVLVQVSGPATDAGVRTIIAPTGILPYQAQVTPTATWHNFGSAPVNVRTYLFIEKAGVRVLRDSVLIANLLPNGLDTVVRFQGWVASQVGEYIVRCSTWCSGDADFTNDTLTSAFGVANVPVGEWVQMRDVPAAASGRPVYYGGGLAGDQSDLYALKGNKTNEVFAYSIAGNDWRQLPDLPEGTTMGKPVGKGGAITTDGNGRLYVARGNKTFDFHRYDPVIGWVKLPDVPLGASGKSLRGGTGIAHAVVNDTGYVYLLKGTSTPEFFRYNTVRDSWEQLTDAPAGLSGKTKYKDGSALARRGDSLVLCLKCKYNEVFHYNTRTSTWVSGQLTIPAAGSGGNKKVKAGGSLAWGNSLLVAVKGGNSTEFWRLDGADSVWREYPQVPRGPSGRRVKDGAGLQYNGGNYYLLKGAKSVELWRFHPNVGGGTQTLELAGAPAPACRLLVLPNPVNNRALVRLAGIKLDRPVVFRLFDAAGRTVFVVKAEPAAPHVLLRTDGLAPGVYFVKAESGPTTAGSKLVVSR